jgi:hypothetical protein
MLSATEQVWRHLLVGSHEGKRRWPSLGALSDELGMGTSTIHGALRRPKEIGAVVMRPGGGVSLIDPGALQLAWGAGRRHLARDIRRRFRAPVTAPEAEQMLSEHPFIIGGFGAAVAAHDANTIADYETVIAYGDPEGIFVSLGKHPADGPGTCEVIICEPDPLLARYGPVTPLCQAWADLFCLGGWQAGYFWHALLPEVASA